MGEKRSVTESETPINSSSASPILAFIGLCIFGKSQHFLAKKQRVEFFSVAFFDLNYLVLRLSDADFIEEELE